ncbi:proprotein convertase P-domain-containing protein [Nocardioides sp. LHD-245]|uniref:proprotein convertase P-domain-containing protein n=1 Tax=Nocardioides sp. LHD-245 TaxID=3051387 RepID=UPI0027E02802|nr:proprotein convertase P-domain-containing protein [Nocardioides sp. LHD-245]
MRRLALMTAGVITLGGLAGLTTAGPAQAASGTFTNSAAIAIADATTVTRSVSVSPFGGSITDVDVVLTNLSHTFAADLDVYLRAPGDANQAVKLMSDACGGGPINGTFTFDDEAAASLPGAGCASGSFRPTNVAEGDNTPAGLTVAPSLSVFDGRNPVGSWTLYVVDDAGGDIGTISGGFSVRITTESSVIDVPVTGNAVPYPYQLDVSGEAGAITDLDVRLDGVSHTWPTDLDILLVGPTGASALLVSDTCGTGDVDDVDWRFDDSAPAMPPGGPCPTGTYRPTNNDNTEAFAPPAPGAPYGAALSAFNGSSPNGTWRLFVTDDSSPDGGFVTSVELIVRTDAPGNTTITSKPRKNTTKRKATIGFTADKGNVTFQCKVDAKAWKACSSPLRVKKLKPGKHKVRVRSVGTSGQVETTPAVVKWRVRR